VEAENEERAGRGHSSGSASLVKSLDGGKMKNAAVIKDSNLEYFD